MHSILVESFHSRRNRWRVISNSIHSIRLVRGFVVAGLNLLLLLRGRLLLLLLLLGLMVVVVLLLLLRVLAPGIVVVVGIVVIIGSPASSSSHATTTAPASSTTVRTSTSAASASIVHHVAISDVCPGWKRHVSVRCRVVRSTVRTAHLHVRWHASRLHGIHGVRGHPRTASYLLWRCHVLWVSRSPRWHGSEIGIGRVHGNLLLLLLLLLGWTLRLRRLVRLLLLGTLRRLLLLATTALLFLVGGRVLSLAGCACRILLVIVGIPGVGVPATTTSCWCGGISTARSR